MISSGIWRWLSLASLTSIHGMMVLQLVRVMAMVVETKGLPLEEIQRKPGVIPG